jgi:dTDP-4-amino-4,6-dideoxygalactose transaminase
LLGQYSAYDVILTDSGTSALALALKVLRDETDAPVALPAYCCYDVATAAAGAGVRILWYDLDPATLSPDLGSLRACFRAGARSVVVAHLYGLPADIGSVESLADEFDALLIEDAAQGSGCAWRERPAGAHGALGVLSFGRGKGMTGGKGGALLINDERLAETALSMWNRAGRPARPRGSLPELMALGAQWLFGRPALYGIPARLPFLGLGETIYRQPHPLAGLTALAAGVLAKTLPLARDEAALRRLNAGGWRAALSGNVQCTPPADWTAGWLRFPIVLPAPALEMLTSWMVAGGAARGYPLALPDLEVVRANGTADAGRFPGARLLAERLATLPTYLPPDNELIRALGAVGLGSLGPAKSSLAR